jgi:hypothetical protein
LDYWHFKLLPSVATAIHLPTYSATLFVPLRSVFSLQKFSEMTVFLIWFAFGEVREHLNILSFFLKPTSAIIQLYKLAITMFLGLFFMICVSIYSSKGLTFWSR